MVRRRPRAQRSALGRRRQNTPVPFSVQGVVYLEDTMARRARPRRASCRGRLTFDDSEAVAVEGLPISSCSLPWTSSADGVGTRPRVRRRVDGVRGDCRTGIRRRSTDRVEHLDRPRVSAYVAMLPVDAAPFLGDRPPDTALSLRTGTPSDGTRGDRVSRATHESTAGAAAAAARRRPARIGARPRAAGRGGRGTDGCRRSGGGLLLDGGLPRSCVFVLSLLLRLVGSMLRC